VELSEAELEVPVTLVVSTLVGMPLREMIIDELVVTVVNVVAELVPEKVVSVVLETAVLEEETVAVMLMVSVVVELAVAVASVVLVVIVLVIGEL
jgi:hypothetical protein